MADRGINLEWKETELKIKSCPVAGRDILGEGEQRNRTEVRKVLDSLDKIYFKKNERS